MFYDSLDFLMLVVEVSLFFKSFVTIDSFCVGFLCVILRMMGARRWPKSAVELPPGQMQFGRPPTPQAGLVILGDMQGSSCMNGSAISLNK